MLASIAASFRPANVNNSRAICGSVFPSKGCVASGPAVPYTSRRARSNARRAAPFVLSRVPSMSKRSKRRISFLILKRWLLAGLLAATGAIWFFIASLPWPVLLPSRNPGATSFIKQRIAESRAAGKPLRIRQSWRPLGQISRNLRRAVLVAEDARFYEHHGIDWQALSQEVRYSGDAEFSWFDLGDVRAVFGSLSYYLTHRDRVRGRSTLTQQLAKNLYFKEGRSLTRKVGEFVVAGRLEWVLSRDRILERYLNVVEWVHDVVGADAAAGAASGRV